MNFYSFNLLLLVFMGSISFVHTEFVYADEEPQKIYNKYINVKTISENEYQELIKITRKNFTQKNISNFFKIIESAHYFDSDVGLELTDGSIRSMDEKNNYFSSGKAFKDLLDPNETTLLQLDVAEKGWLDGLTRPKDQFGELDFFSVGDGSNMAIHEHQSNFFKEMQKVFHLDQYPDRRASFVRAWIEVCATNGDLGDSSTAILKEFDKNPAMITESLSELKNLYAKNLEKLIKSDFHWSANRSRLSRFSHIGDKKEVDYFYYSGLPVIDKLKGYKNWVRFQNKYNLDFQNKLTSYSDYFITLLNNHVRYKKFIELLKSPEIQREIEESKSLYSQFLEIREKKLRYGNTFFDNIPIHELIKKFNTKLAWAVELNSRVYPKIIGCINKYKNEISKNIE